MSCCQDTVFLVHMSLRQYSILPRIFPIAFYEKKIFLFKISLNRTEWLTHWGWDKMANIFKTSFSKCIFLNENIWISLKISLEFVPKVRINNIPSLVQIMAWRRSGDKPLSEPMMVSLLSHICVTRHQWVNGCHRVSVQARNQVKTIMWKIWWAILLCFHQFAHNFSVRFEHNHAWFDTAKSVNFVWLISEIDRSDLSGVN